MVYTKQYLDQQEAKQVQDRISSFMKNFRFLSRICGFPSGPLPPMITLASYELW